MIRIEYGAEVWQIDTSINTSTYTYINPAQYASTAIDELRLDLGGYFFIDDLDLTKVSSVPVPAAVWLFGSALLGLIGFTKRKNSV